MSSRFPKPAARPSEVPHVPRKSPGSNGAQRGAGATDFERPPPGIPGTKAPQGGFPKGAAAGFVDEHPVATCVCGHPMHEHMDAVDFCTVDGCGCHLFRDADDHDPA